MKLNFNEVLLLVKDRKFEEAIKYLNQLIKDDGENFQYYHLKGTLHFNIDELSEAIKSFSSALDINKKDSNIYYLRGVSHLKSGKYTEAKKDFDEAIILKENFSEAYYGLGVLHSENDENTLAIENFLKSINFKNNFKQPVINLIKTLTQTKNTKKYDSIIIDKHKQINEIDFPYSFNKYIEDFEIKKFLIKIDSIINDNFENLNFSATQIYRRNHNSLNCKRHKKIFNTYEVIPKFCFGCYKVQIEPDNIVDLIKLYIIFDNIELDKNNTRKCMIEVRPNIKGEYKGLIYCDSIEESKLILNQINLISKINLNKELFTKIKRGCSEFGIKYDKYDSLDNDALNYKNEWNEYENIIDKRFHHLASIKNDVPTIKGVTLNDALILKNWILHAKKNEDNSIRFID